jgi:hypothetical protein
MMNDSKITIWQLAANMIGSLGDKITRRRNMDQKAEIFTMVSSGEIKWNQTIVTDPEQVVDLEDGGTISIKCKDGTWFDGKIMTMEVDVNDRSSIEEVKRKVVKQLIDKMEKSLLSALQSGEISKEEFSNKWDKLEEMKQAERNIPGSAIKSEELDKKLKKALDNGGFDNRDDQLTAIVQRSDIPTGESAGSPKSKAELIEEIRSHYKERGQDVPSDHDLEMIAELAMKNTKELEDKAFLALKQMAERVSSLRKEVNSQQNFLINRRGTNGPSNKAN